MLRFSSEAKGNRNFRSIGLPNLIAKKENEKSRLVKLITNLMKLNSVNENDTSLPLDFSDCNMDALCFREIVNSCVALFQRQRNLVVPTLNLDNLNDDCQEDLVKLIQALPISDFCTGSIGVEMDAENIQAIQNVLSSKQKEFEAVEGTFFISLNNTKQVALSLDL